MSLRYGHLFDTTIRAEYERALDLAKNRIGALPQPANTATAEPAATWMTGPTIKTALASGGQVPGSGVARVPSFRR